METKSLYAFGLLSFATVYRESFESVLFLRALSLEVGNEQGWAIGAGALAALFTMGALTLIFSRLSLKLPIRQLCQISSVMMIGLSVVLLGKSIHAFQETGFVSITLFPVAFRFEFLGIFPTYETWIAQALGLTAILAIYFLKEGSWFGRRTPS